MPVVHIRALRCDGRLAAELPAVARAVALAVPCPLDSVWCTLDALEAQSVGARLVDGKRDGDGGIVYVEVWLRDRDEGGAAAGRALEAACRAAADAAGVPVEDAWGVVHPVLPTRVFAGGGLLA